MELNTGAFSHKTCSIGKDNDWVMHQKQSTRECLAHLCLVFINLTLQNLSLRALDGADYPHIYFVREVVGPGWVICVEHYSNLHG